MPLRTVPIDASAPRDVPRVVPRIPPYALLDLTRLATLREVERCGSYSAAADSLNFSPSAVSQQMTVLARELGFRLFDRTPRGMRLTTAAEVLVSHVETVFARLNDAQAELDEVAGGARGRLRVGSFPTATARFVAETMGEFRDRLPAVQVSLSDGEPHESVGRLKSRELDLAVVFDFDHWALASDFDGRDVCSHSEIECVDLFDDPFFAILPRDHPLAASERVEIAQLEGERIIGGPAGCSPWGPDLRHRCRQAGFEPDLELCYHTLDFASLQAIVATGRGLTLVPHLALLPEHPDVVARPLIGGPVRHVRVAALAGVAATLADTAMVELLQAVAMRFQAPPAPLAVVAG